MNKSSFLAAVIGVFLLHSVAHSQSQSQELPKYEVAAEFTTFERDSFSTRTEPGLGGRFTFNLNRVFSLEAAGYFFPKECFSCRNDGRVIQAVGGVKVGKRFDKWGIFGKARPGIVSFSDGEFNIVPTGGPVNPLTSFQVETNRVTSFATDIGAVLEFYPSKRIVTRFDAGDTIIYFTRRTTNQFRFDPLTNSFFVGPVTSPARTTHSFQFMASVGFRF
jgi:hypothetical protein